MCSTECPCFTKDAQNWIALGEGKLNEYQRTLTQRTIGANGDALQDDKGRYRLFTSADPTLTYYQNFADCHVALQAKFNAATTNTNADIPSGANIETGLKILTYFEDKYTCSGVCSPALFYYKLNLDRGVPSKTCLLYMKEEVGNSLSYLGISALVTGGTMFLIWVCQYALWRKYDEKHPFDNRN